MVKVSVAELPLLKVNGPATTVSPPFFSSVHEAPFHPSPKLSYMCSVWDPTAPSITVLM
jgi:hypothetical protein